LHLKLFPILKQISSAQNPFIKKLVQLQEKAKVRKETNTFLIEGKREFMLAIKGNYSVETILYVPQLTSKEDLHFYIQNAENCIEITQEVYQKLAYRDSTEGIVAVVKTKSHKIENLELPKNPLILVFESIEKPGNLGAMLRTADAANVDAILIANPKSDLYNPNLIRSSVGCVFTNTIAIGSSEEIINYLKNQAIAIFAATLQNSNSYHLQDYSQGSAIVVGTEATGLTEIWRENAKQNIIIPMQGQIDSMNVSVAAAILLFEAKRQRGF
jgi:TrmH family RNA methyltransferase